MSRLLRVRIPYPLALYDAARRTHETRHGTLRPQDVVHHQGGISQSVQEQERDTHTKCPAIMARQVGSEGVVIDVPMDGTVHPQLMKKQGFSKGVFYAFDILVHWVPLWCLHVPFQGFAVNSIGACANLLWGIAISGGTMNLSEVYCHLNMEKWCFLWVLCLGVTIFVPV